MELLPEEGYQKKSSGFIEKESYSGAQLIKNWEGELLYGYFYKNGKRAGSIRLKSKDSNGRTAGWCTTYTTYHLSGTCIERGLIIVYGTSVMVRDQEPLIMPPPPVSADGDPYYCSNWSIDYSTQEQHCYDDGGGDDGGGGGGPAPEPVYPIAIEELKADNTSLYGPCPGLTDSWRYQINFKPPQSVINKLEQLAQDVAFMNSMDRPIENLPNSWFVQSIKNAEGIAINVDNFSVYFTEFPVINGQRVDMNGLMDYVRTNINDFVSPDHGSFSPHSATGTDEGAIWNSSNPVGAVLSIAIPVDQGSVICSQYSPGYQSASWTFSTIHDPYNNNHPVSGNRTFGIYESGNGWVFYTQGADRLTGYFDSLLGIVTKAMNGQELQFAKSDEMWKNFQAKIAQFLNENDGISGVNTAEVRTPVTNRPDWQKVKEALENNLSLSTVPCP